MLFCVEFDKGAGAWKATDTGAKYSFTFDQARVSLNGRIENGVRFHGVHGLVIADEVVERLRCHGGLRHLGLIPHSKVINKRMAQLLPGGKVEIEKRGLVG